AVVVALADVPARLALAPVETPVGAWTALLGVPAGVALLRSGKRDRTGRRPGRDTGLQGPREAGSRYTGTPGEEPRAVREASIASTPEGDGPSGVLHPIHGTTAAEEAR
ncbi:iron ABC transporter permease, partial [Streptomyces sp. T-3]|nr:iron ABC transporter permease [Streptomyces sp. T-3]